MRLSALNRESAVWEAARGQLDERGFALIPAVLSPEICDEIVGYYADERRFRSRIEMARYAFGRGEYKYFAYPLPKVVQQLRDSIYPELPYATADILFHPGSNSVMAIWVVFWREHGKPFLSPNVDECLRVLGEPSGRNYIPNPFESRKEPPKHWYCQMAYKPAPLVLYFADGQLMALEVNPKAKGIAPEGEGSDDYSIGFCLQ